MRKILYTLVGGGMILLSLPGHLSAQDLSIEPRFGVGQGIVENQGSIPSYLDEVEEADSVTMASFDQEMGNAFHVGASVDYALGDGSMIRSGIHYRSTKWSTDLAIDKEEGGGGGGTSTEATEKIRSEGEFQVGGLVVPVLFRYQKEWDKFMLYGAAGIDVGLRLSAGLDSEEKVTSTTENNVSGTKTTETNTFHADVELDGLPTLNATLAGDLGAGYRLGPGHLTLGIRVSKGFGGELFTTDGDLRPGQGDGAAHGKVFTKKGQERIQEDHDISFDDFATLNWSIGLGYRIPLGGS